MPLKKILTEKDKELVLYEIVKIYGFTSINDDNTEVSVNSLRQRKDVIPMINNNFIPLLKKYFAMSHFNLARLQYKIFTHIQAMAILRKTLDLINVPHTIKKHKNFSSVRLNTKDFNSYRLYKRMAHNYDSSQKLFLTELKEMYTFYRDTITSSNFNKERSCVEKFMDELDTKFKLNDKSRVKIAINDYIKGDISLNFLRDIFKNEYDNLKKKIDEISKHDPNPQMNIIKLKNESFLIKDYNIICKNMKINTTKSNNFGIKTDFTILRTKIDFLNNVIVNIKIKKNNSTFKQNIADKILKYVELEIGGSKIQGYYSMYTDILNKIYKKEPFSYIDDEYINLKIPLHLWFTKENRNLCLKLLLFNIVKIKLELESLDNLLETKNDEPHLEELNLECDYTNGSLSDLKVNCDNVNENLSYNEYLLTFCNKKLTFPIDYFQFTGTELIRKKTDTFRVNFNNFVNYIVIVSKKKINKLMVLFNSKCHYEASEIDLIYNWHKMFGFLPSSSENNYYLIPFNHYKIDLIGGKAINCNEIDSLFLKIEFNEFNKKDEKNNQLIIIGNTIRTGSIFNGLFAV